MIAAFLEFVLTFSDDSYLFHIFCRRFLFTQRLHRETSVRRAVVMACAVVFQVVPPEVAVDAFRDETAELAASLRDVCEHDPDDVCRDLAVHALRIFQARLLPVFTPSLSIS